MSRLGLVSFVWGDGEHAFRLPFDGLVELQEKLGASPFDVHRRLSAGVPMASDAREVLRIGLVYGGLAPPEAVRLVKRWADERPAIESLLPALTVLGAALFGVADEAPGKSEGTEPPPPPTVD